MANEYGELEQLVNDVTNLDTARMTLRWALERLNSIEKERADLKKNLVLAEDASKQLQGKLGALEESFRIRYKSLGEKESFYSKLEATMSLLGEGKLDIQQFLKKEARLDQLRQSLENEYQEKFEELDRNQRSVIERWNARLLEVESQYAARLSEAQKKYDSLRSELDTDHQGRLLVLQKTFAARESRLTERINLLETSAEAGEQSLEERKKKLETEFYGKKLELDENYRKLKNTLERDLEEKMRSVDSDHGEQVKSLELSWKTERVRLIEEQRVREEQFSSAQARIKEVENLLASQQESHHGELIKIINEKETAFLAKMEALEKEKEVYTQTIQGLQKQIGEKEAQWEQEREKLRTEFSQNVFLINLSVQERAAGLEKEYAAKKEELDKVVAAARQEFEAQFKSRLAFERAAMEKDKSRAKETQLSTQEALKKADEKIKGLEKTLSVLQDEHHRELMSIHAAGQAAFREKIAQFEAEKKAYNRTIDKLAEEMRAKEEALLAEKENFSKQASDKAAVYQAQLSEKESVFDLERMAFDEKMTALRAELSEREKAFVLERENFSNALEKVSSEAQAIAEERVAGVRSEYEERKAVLEREFEVKFADRVKALEFEKARAGEELAVKDGQLNRACEKVKALEKGMESLKAEYSNEKARLAKSEEEKLRTLAAEFNMGRAGYAEDLILKEAAFKEQLEALRVSVSEKEKALVIERENFSNALVKVSAEAKAIAEERIAGIRSEYEERKAALKREFEVKFADRVKALEFEKARAGEELAVKDGQLNRACEKVKALEGGIESLKAEYSNEKARLAKSQEEKLKALAAGFDIERAGYAEETIMKEAAFKEQLEALRVSVLEKEKELVLERENLSNALEKVSAEAQAIAEERIADIRSEYEERKAALKREFEVKFSDRVKALEFEKARVAEAVAVKDGQLAQAYERVKRIEAELERMRVGHNDEKTRLEYAKEEQLRSLAAHFEAERADLLRSFGKKEAVFKEQINGLREELSGKEKALAIERENLSNEFARASAEANALAEERIARAAEDYEAQKTVLEREFEVKFADRVKALEFEKARAAEAVSVKDGQLTQAYEQVKRIEAELERMRVIHNEEKVRLEHAKEEQLRSLAAHFEAERAELFRSFGQKEAVLKEKINVLGVELSGKEKALAIERENLSNEFARASTEANALAEERIAKAAEGYEAQKAMLAEEFEVKFADRVKALEFEKELAAERVEKIRMAYEARKDELKAQFEKKLAVHAASMEFKNEQVNEELVAVKKELAATEGHARELESELSADRRTHHAELMGKLADKEAALKVQDENFAKELALKDELLAKYTQESAAKVSRWAEEKEALISDFAVKFQLLEKNLVEREKALAAGQVEKIKSEYEAGKVELEKRYSEKLSSASSALAFEKSRMVADLNTASAEYTRLAEQFKELERTIASDRQRHHTELMEKLADKEAALKAQSYNFSVEMARMRETFGAREASWMDEKEEMNAALLETSARAEREIKERAVHIAAEYGNKRSELERILGERMAEKEAVLKLETRKVMEESRIKDAQLAAAHERVKGLENKVNVMSGAHHGELMARLAEK